MKRVPWLVALVATASCEASNDPPPAAVAPRTNVTSPVDDGTFLERIDPLGGQWRVESIGDDDLQPFKAWVNFSAGGFLNHG
ncbi:MAG TPA: hypothetical protein VJ775_03125, partial [Sphingomicrobium sp.]|nr:hypothetical protein [Sphingomicrobium sp.]